MFDGKFISVVHSVTRVSSLNTLIYYCTYRYGNQFIHQSEHSITVTCYILTNHSTVLTMFPLIQGLHYHNISSCGSDKNIENCFCGAVEAELPWGAKTIIFARATLQLHAWPPATMILRTQYWVNPEYKRMKLLYDKGNTVIKFWSFLIDKTF